MQGLIHKRKLKRFPLMIALFLMLSIPLAVYGLVSLNNFDTSSNASNQDSAVNSCFINFPYVNPESIQVDKKVQVQISAYVPGERIKKINIIDNSGNPVFQKEYTQATDRVIDIFIFSPKAIGTYNFMGTVTTENVSRPCVVQSTKGVNVVATNTVPLFQTLPSSALPSNAIKVGDNYQYTLKVTDAQSDTINYSFSFTPDTNWLKYTVIDDGGKGKLTIKFSGKPDKPASYLANIFIHDGYINHLVSQSWVISVDQDKNDIPKVTVYEPATAQTVKLGDTVKISWNVQDLNQITKYDLYYATNPGNSSTWVPIVKGLSVKFGHYIFDTSKLAIGKYTFIVQATDNYNPPATGTGVSPEITIDSKSGDHQGPDDGPQLVDPQIINISPTNNSQIKNKRAAISATLIAGTDSTVKKDSIKLIFDDTDITNKASINVISDTEYAVVYNPTDDYKIGAHKIKISFEDSKGSKGNKEWNFELIADGSNNDNVNIFGWSIPKRTLYIIAGGIGLLILALLIPWLLYLAWRGSKDQEEYDYTNVYKQSKTMEYDTTGRMEQYSTITPRPIIPVIPVETTSETTNTYAKLDSYSYEQPKEEPSISSSSTFLDTNTSTVITPEPTVEVNTIDTKIEEPIIPEPVIEVEKEVIEPTIQEPIVTEEPKTVTEIEDTTIKTTDYTNSYNPYSNQINTTPEASTVITEPIVETTTVTQPPVVETVNESPSEPIQIFNTVTPLPTTEEQPFGVNPPTQATVNPVNEVSNDVQKELPVETYPNVTNINVNITQNPQEPTPQIPTSTPTQYVDITPIEPEVVKPVVTNTSSPAPIVDNSVTINGSTSSQSTSRITEDVSGDLPPIISGIDSSDDEDEIPDLDGDSYEELLRLAEQLDEQEKEQNTIEDTNKIKTGTGENIITAPSPLPDETISTIKSSSDPNQIIKPQDDNQQITK